MTAYVFIMYGDLLNIYYAFTLGGSIRYNQGLLK
jgi:hypothetical protein